MPRRAPRAAGKETPHTGELLRQGRGDKPRSAVVQLLGRIGIEAAESTLLRYEDGRVPDILVLYGLSQIYRLPFEPLIRALVYELRTTGATFDDIARHVRDLPFHGHGGKTSATSVRGFPHHEHSPSSDARLLELEQTIADYELVTAGFRDTLGRIATFADGILDAVRIAAPPETGRPAEKKAKPRRDSERPA